MLRFWTTHAAKFRALGPGKIAIDCGANVGKITQRLAKQGARVYAFEPHPVAFSTLKQRFQSQSNVICCNQAVWNRAATMRLYLHEHDAEDPIYWSTGASLLAEKPNVQTKDFIKVTTIDLAQFILDLGKTVTLLKIDVEGVECDILEHLLAKNVLPQIDAVLVETHEKKLPILAPRVAKLKERFQAQGITNVFLDWD